MQKSLMLSPSKTGLLILPFYILLLFANFISGFWISRHGTKWPLLCSISLILIGFILTIYLLPEKNYTSILPIIIGLGIGLDTVVNTTKTIIIESIPKEHIGTALGIQNNFGYISATISFAILSSIISHYITNNIHESISYYNGFRTILIFCLILIAINFLLSFILTRKVK